MQPTRRANFASYVATAATGACLFVILACISACAGSDHPGSPALVGSYETTTEPWTFRGSTGTLIKSRSFRIFTTLPPGHLIDLFPNFIEAALDGYTSALLPLPRPPRTMDTFLMRDRDEWALLTQRVMGKDAGPYLKMQRGGLTSEGRSLLFDVGRTRDTLMLAAHEGWHQYTQTTFKEPLPMWMEEGLATYMEGFRQDRTDPSQFSFMPWANMERFFALREGARLGRLVSLEVLLDSTPQDLMAHNANAALLYYGQVWGFVQFLCEFDQGRYRPALHRMIEDARDGVLVAHVRAALGGKAALDFLSRRRGAEPLRAYLDVDANTLNDQYQRFVGQIVAPGNERLISQGRRPAFED